MSVIWTKNRLYKSADYQSEADLEAAIIELSSELFGQSRIYLDVKKKIGRKGKKGNVPDGYLIDLSGHRPQLFVVEVELERHHHLKHIAVQILEFSLSFESEPRTVKTILLNALQEQPEAIKICEDYLERREDIRNLDHMMEWMVFEREFAALIIIDQMPDDLEDILMKKFQFGVEVIELAKYESVEGERIYSFEPFLEDLIVDVGGTKKTVDASEVDTIVVPAKGDGFKDVFLAEDRWHAVRIHGTMRPKIKYIAAYQTAPVQAITHLASVKSIEPWKDTTKYVINFAEPAEEIGPIALVKNGRVKAPQAPRYATREQILAAHDLDEVW